MRKAEFVQPRTEEAEGRLHGGLQLFMRGVEGQCWALLSGDGNRALEDGMELHQEKARWELGKDSAPESVGHRTGYPGQRSWSWCQSSRSIWTQLSDIGFGWCRVEPRVGLSDSCRSLPTQDILLFCDSVIKEILLWSSPSLIPLLPVKSPLNPFLFYLR